MIPCQPRAAPKAVVLWSKGTEILVNSSRYEPSPSAPSDSGSTPPPGLAPASGTTGCSQVSQVYSIPAAE